MKKILYNGILFLTAFMFIDCDNNLDLEPEQSLSPEVVTSSPENIRSLLVGIYDEAAHGSAETVDFEENVYGGRLNLAIELLANSGELNWNGTFDAPDELNEKAVQPNNLFIRDYWVNAYEVSNQVNIVLANLGVFESDSERNTVEGEAKFLRGMVYFDLARLYGQQYQPGAQNSQLGVPIVLEAVLNPEDVTFPTRNTVEEVYTQVIGDLTDAYNLLPDSNDVFADKYAARALLARVYLQQGNYVAARDAADDVLQNSGHSLTTDFASAFNNDEDAVEDIFAWQITSQDGTNEMNTFWSGEDFGGRSGNPDMAIDVSHLDIYDDTDDARRGFFYENSGGTATTKWQSQFANIPFLRIAEMHLIRAECNFREGTSIGLAPEAEITALRTRSGAALLAGITLQDILDERRRELAFEGFALHDIKRLQGIVGALNYDDNALVMPVPQRETDANSNLLQNPGYN